MDILVSCNHNEMGEDCTGTHFSGFATIGMVKTIKSSFRLNLMTYRFLVNPLRYAVRFFKKKLEKKKFKKIYLILLF